MSSEAPIRTLNPLKIISHFIIPPSIHRYLDIYFDGERTDPACSCSDPVGVLVHKHLQTFLDSDISQVWFVIIIIDKVLNQNTSLI